MLIDIVSVVSTMRNWSYKVPLRALRDPEKELAQPDYWCFCWLNGGWIPMAFYEYGTGRISHLVMKFFLSPYG